MSKRVTFLVNVPRGARRRVSSFAQMPTVPHDTVYRGYRIRYSAVHGYFVEKDGFPIGGFVASDAAARAIVDEVAGEGRRNAPKRAARSRGKTRVRKRSTMQTRHKKRNPPRGFKTWRAYMASIRPGGKKRRKHSTARAKTVKRPKHHKRRRRNPVANPPKRRRHHRRNPPMFASLGKLTRGNGPIPFVIATAGRVVVGLGGEIFVRKVRGTVFKQAPGTIVGSLIEGGLALAGGFALSLLHEGAGLAFAQGALSAPVRTELQQLAIPHISDSLGDDGFLMGPGTGVTLISAFPDDYRRVADGADGDASLGRYVSGDTAATPLQGYVAGNINNAA